MKSLLSVALSFTLLTSFSLIIQETQAIPSFARKYKTSCTTCHYAYPKLNAFGKAFKNNGYRYPAGQDLEMTKEEPVSMGSEAYKKVFPNAIWPSDMAGSTPLSFRAIGRVYYDNAVQDEKSAYFEMPHELELLYGGTFGDKISYYGEIEYEHESEFAYLFTVSYNFNPAFNIKLGSVGLQATPGMLKLGINNYSAERLRTQSGAWRMADGAGGGMEIWGAGNGQGGKGGFTYAVGVGNGQNDADNFDLNKNKDYYGRVTYKIGGLGEIGGTTGQASEESAFYLDNSFRLGGFYYSGTALSGGINDKFSVIGGDIDWWFNRLNVDALVMTMKSDTAGVQRSSLAYFIGGHYVVFPWLIPSARYEYTDKDVDDNSQAAASNLITGITFMVRANVKVILEYMMPLDNLRKNDDQFGFQVDFAF